MIPRTGQAARLSKRFWRNSRLRGSFALLTVVALAATGTFAVEDSATPSTAGLAGLFPATPPADLGDEEFSKLDGNWADWSKGAAAVVVDFYTNLQTSDVAAQRKALATLKLKLDVMRRALDDPRYTSLFDPLASLHNSLTTRIEFAEGILDTLEFENPQYAAEKARAKSTELLAAIKSLESDLGSIANGPLWLPYFRVAELKAALTADAVGAEALAVAKASSATLKSRDTALSGAQKTFTHRPAFEKYAEAVKDYLSVSVWVHSPDAVKNLRADIKTLAEALDTFLVTGGKAPELRLAITKIREQAPDNGERLLAALQKRLFNYNMRLLVTEEFMNKLMSQKRTESGPVRDYIMEASVSGNQTTDTTIGVDLKPSNSTARFDLVLKGHIQSNTVGVTSQASVWTYGNHTFVAQKEVNFDGQKFTTLPATITVNPHNTTTGINTYMSGTLFGGIAQNTASREVEARRGQTEAIAASRVREGVLPKFDKEVDNAFATQGVKLNDELFAGLRASGLFPDSYSYQTSDRLLTVNARLMNDKQLAANLPETSLMMVKGATALMHETVLNNAIDQIGLAGQTLTEPELRQKIEEFLSKALNRPFKFEAPAPAADAPAAEEEKGPNGIIFAPEDPIRIRVNHGELTIVIRAGFKQEGKEDIPMREVTVPISFEVQGEKILVKRGNVQVAAAEGQGGGISINAVVRKKIQSVMPDRVVDGKIEFKSPEKTASLPQKIVFVHVTQLKLTDGWIAVSVD